jgi:DNA polymerase III subunit epsilon
LDFVAIDFETANNSPHSICAVGICTINQGVIVDEYYSLIQPPGNYYNYYNTRIHGIKASDTEYELSFPDIYPEIKKRLLGKKIIAHNESFDRGVLQKTMAYYDIQETELSLKYPWICTVKIYKKKKEGKVNLKSCCDRHDINLTHHNAMSDARACALLYWKHLAPLFA